MNVSGMVTSGDIYQLVSELSMGLSVLPQEINVGSSAASKTLIMTYGASTLLAVGSTSLSGRTQLTVKNCGRNTVLIGPSSEQAIYEEGLPVEPGETKVIKFSSGTSIDLYGRSMGYACEVKVWE